MPLDTEQLSGTRVLTEQEQHANARAFITEANAEIQRLVAEIENVKAVLPETEPTQAQIDSVITGAEALTQAAAQEAAAPADTHSDSAPEETTLVPEHIEDINTAIARLDNDSPPPPIESGGSGDSGDGEPPSHLFNLSYNRANEDADAQQLADLYAEKRISDDLEKGSRFNKLVKRAFEGNVARQFYRERYKLEYERLVRESGGEIYAPIEQLYGMDADNSLAASKEARKATLERVMNDGFRNNQESDQAIAGGGEAEDKVRATIKDLALRYAAGELDDDSIIVERDRLFGEIEGLNDTLFGKGVHFADNMLELARNVRAEAEHSDGLERVQAALDSIILSGAVAKSGANAELKQTIFDKISRRIHTSRIGGTAIGTAVLLAGAIVFSGSRRAAQSTTATALRLTGIGAAAAGGIASGNEYAAVRREAAFGRTEYAFGVEHDEKSNSRRREINTINYEAQDVGRAIEEMRIYIGENGEFHGEARDEDLQNAQDLLERIKTLRDYGEEHKIDLLRFSGVSASARERLNLMQTMCELELAIAARVAQGGEILVTGVDGVQTSQPVGETLRLQAESMRKNTLSAIVLDASTKDTAYKKMMAKRVAVAFVAGSVAGVVVGAVVQEGVALASPAVTGVFEQQTPGQPNTLLNSLIFGQKNSNANVAAVVHEHLVTQKGSNATLKIPNDFDAHFGQNNSVDLIDKASGKSVVHNLHFNKNGHLDAHSLKELHGMGVTTSEVITSIKGPAVHVTANEFYQANKAHLVRSHNTLMMNDTHNPDLNELHFYAAGKDGSWVDGHGDIRIRVDGITQGGSFEGSQHVNPLDAVHKGHLKVFMSPDKAHGLDNFAYTVKEVNGHYEVVIPKNDPAYQLFDKRTGGHDSAEGFKGRYIGAAVDRGTNARGVHDYAVINSTQGSGDAEFTIHRTQKIVTTHLVFGKTSEAAGSTLPIVSVPVYPRRGIGAPLARREQLLPRPELIRRRDTDPEGYYDSYASPESRKSWEYDRSPRLKDSKDAILNPSEELHWYREHLRERNGEEYVDKLEQQIDSTPELRELPVTTRAIICIPIAAASEAENIYKTLSLYAQQDGVVPGETTLLLHVNWVDASLNDPAKSAAIEKTKAEIERARADFPDLRIAVVESEWNREFMDTQSGIIGHVARKMVDIAMLSTTRAIDMGALSPNQDVLIIRNDADAQGMHRRYIKNMLKGAEDHPESDAFVGTVRWGTSLHSKFPGFGVSSNFKEVMQALNGRPNSRSRLVTGGVNHAIRASTFAAIGGLGSGNYTGAGSDDMEVHSRVYAARGESPEVSGGYASGYAPGGGSTDSKKKPVRHIVAAQIDSAADRTLAAYFGDGNGLIDTWNGFDQGGYTDPDPNDIPDSPEDPKKDIESIAKRIERDISMMSTRWFKDPAQVRTGLAFMFPDTTKDGHQIFSLSWKNGVCEFKFTTVGQYWLADKLTRDSKGRNDPFGSRVARALYGKVSPNSTKLPLAPVSPFVEPI